MEVKVNPVVSTVITEIVTLYMICMLNIDEIHLLMALNQTNFVKCLYYNSRKFTI